VCFSIKIRLKEDGGSEVRCDDAVPQFPPFGWWTEGEKTKKRKRNNEDHGPTLHLAALTGAKEKVMMKSGRRGLPDQ